MCDCLQQFFTTSILGGILRRLGRVLRRVRRVFVRLRSPRRGAERSQHGRAKATRGSSANPWVLFMVFGRPHFYLL